MASIYVKGVRLDWVRPCAVCGRKPSISTSYTPFVIACDHDATKKDYDRAEVQSWHKTSVVRDWNAMQARIKEKVE